MRRPLAILAAAAAVSLAACHRPEPVGEGEPRVLATGTADTVAGTGSAEELRGKLRQWTEARGGRDYEFTVARSCFCVEAARRPVVVRVVGDRVASVADSATGQAPSIEYPWMTIEGLFAGAIADAEAGRGHPVTYSTVGYPVQIAIGQVEVDAGSFFAISRVVIGGR
jgi:hypothetical protein